MNMPFCHTGRADKIPAAHLVVGCLDLEERRGTLLPVVARRAFRARRDFAALTANGNTAKR